MEGELIFLYGKVHQLISAHDLDLKAKMEELT